MEWFSDDLSITIPLTCVRGTVRVADISCSSSIKLRVSVITFPKGSNLALTISHRDIDIPLYLIVYRDNIKIRHDVLTVHCREPHTGVPNDLKNCTHTITEAWVAAMCSIQKQYLTCKLRTLATVPRNLFHLLFRSKNQTFGHPILYPL